MKWNRKDFLSARGSVLVGPGFDPSDLDPSGFDPGGFDPSGFDPSGFEKNSSTVVQSYSRAGLAQWPPIYPKSAPSWVQNEPKLPPKWAHLGPKLAQVGPSRPKWCSSLRKSAQLKAPEALWAGSWGLLGPSWALLGRSWGPLGGS